MLASIRLTDLHIKAYSFFLGGVAAAAFVAGGLANFTYATRHPGADPYKAINAQPRKEPAKLDAIHAPEDLEPLEVSKNPPQISHGKGFTIPFSSAFATLMKPCITQMEGKADQFVIDKKCFAEKTADQREDEIDRLLGTGIYDLRRATGSR